MLYDNGNFPFCIPEKVWSDDAATWDDVTVWDGGTLFIEDEDYIDPSFGRVISHTETPSGSSVRKTPVVGPGTGYVGMPLRDAAALYWRVSRWTLANINLTANLYAWDSFTESLEHVSDLSITSLFQTGTASATSEVEREKRRCCAHWDTGWEQVPRAYFFKYQREEDNLITIGTGSETFIGSGYDEVLDRSLSAFVRPLAQVEMLRVASDPDTVYVRIAELISCMVSAHWINSSFMQSGAGMFSDYVYAWDTKQYGVLSMFKRTGHVTVSLFGTDYLIPTCSYLELIGFYPDVFDLIGDYFSSGNNNITGSLELRPALWCSYNGTYNTITGNPL